MPFLSYLTVEHVYAGTGFTLGNIDLDDYILKALCVELQIVVVNIDYRRVFSLTSLNVPDSAIPRFVPEHKFPTPLNDCYTTLKWVRRRELLTQRILLAELRHEL